MYKDMMEDSLLDYIGIDPAYYFIGIAGLMLIFIIIMIVQQVKIKKLNRRLNVFMSGKDTVSLEQEFQNHFDEMNGLKDVLVNHTNAIKGVTSKMKECYSKMGIVKYDAFREMGGNMSFALCLLNEKNDGMLLNSMHSREGCYTYIKEIVNGESYIELSAEEQEALDNALNVADYSLKEKKISK